jgi:probable rRNA maturation factor
MKRAGRSESHGIPEIVVHNRQRKISIDVAELQRFAGRALELCLRSPRKTSTLMNLAEIDVVLVSDRSMSELHRRFMQIKGPTDIITFEHGEIFIGAETARRQALEFRSATRREIQLYLVHGLLHLHGYDDKSAAPARLMEARQRQILRAAIEIDFGACRRRTPF